MKQQGVGSNEGGRVEGWQHQWWWWHELAVMMCHVRWHSHVEHDNRVLKLTCHDSLHGLTIVVNSAAQSHEPLSQATILGHLS
jgi:hypothetical protein